VIRAPLSVESGTLTRTMKPRRPAIMQLYAPQVQQLLARLRG
jgi:long-chain acyl-CoA synthetase